MIRVSDLVKDKSQLVMEAKVVEAYQLWYQGRAGKQETELILVDLAHASRYYDTTPDGSDAVQLATHNGMRRVFGRILEAINLPLAENMELYTAAQSQAEALGEPE